MTHARAAWRTVTQLAAADLWAERVLALCSVLALAAVLAPLVVLAGLRLGVVQGMRELLLENPHAREIVTAANRTIPAAALETLARWPGVAFLVPRTRTLATSVLVQNGEAGQTARLELLPTSSGDPLLATVPPADDRIVLSAAAAARLRAGPGTVLTMRVVRSISGRTESVPVALVVHGIAAPIAFPREAAFVTIPLAVLIEDFQEAQAEWPPPGVPLPTPQRTDYAGFRLYAQRLDEVPALDVRLRREGYEISSRAGEVAGIQSVDRSLGTLFLVVAGLGGAGFLVSLGAGLWANVERKRVALALMRFLGLRQGALSLFPLLQAFALSACGACLGLAAALVASMAINVALAGLLALDRPLCIVSPTIAAGAVALSIGGGLVAAALASLRAARVEPWEGVSTP